MHVIEEETENKNEITAIKRAFDFISYLMKKSLLGNSCWGRTLPFYFGFSANKKEVARRDMGGLVHYLSLSLYCFLRIHKKIRHSVLLRLLFWNMLLIYSQNDGRYLIRTNLWLIIHVSSWSESEVWCWMGLIICVNLTTCCFIYYWCFWFLNIII